MIYTGRTAPVLTRRQNELHFEEGEKRYHINGRGPYYPWKSRPIGLAGLAGIYIYARLYDTDDQFRHHPPGELGVKFDQMNDWLGVHLPQLWRDHVNVTGKDIDANKLSSRFSNMYRFNETKSFGIGPEHPINHPGVKLAVDEMDALRRERGFSVDAWLEYRV